MGASFIFSIEVRCGKRLKLWKTMPISVRTRPRTEAVTIRAELGDGRFREHPIEVTVHGREFDTSEISVSSKFTKLSKANRARTRRDSKTIKAAWKSGAAFCSGGGSG